MARGKQEAEWERTAVVLAMLDNTRAFRRGRAATADDYNPFRAKARAPAAELSATQGVEILAAVFGA